MKIYYQNVPHIGILVTYDLDGERTYDSLSTLSFFWMWISDEFSNAEVIEITDSNYRQLVEQGEI